MHNIDDNNFFNLNRDGSWPGFHWSGLELRADGALQLASVPLLKTEPPEEIRAARAPEGPAGLAMDAAGTLYFSDPQKNCLKQIDGCDGWLRPVPCTGEGRGGSSQLRSPRGLLIDNQRRALFVADSGNHRIQIFDLETMQLVGVWGQLSLVARSQPGTLPGQFNTPWNMAADQAGNVYVVDYGNNRVQKFNVIGEPVPSFCDNLQASGLLKHPTDIATVERDGKTRVLVLDLPPQAPAAVFVFDAQGNFVEDAAGKALSLQDGHLKQPMGLAAAGDALYVGDNFFRRVFRFQIGESFSFVGEAIGYDGPVASLLLNGNGTIWVHAGLSSAPVKLETQTGHRTQGVLWRDYLEVPGRKVVWHRLLALLEPLAAEAHVELFAYTSNQLSDLRPDFPADNPFADQRWQPVASPGHTDVTDLYIGGKEASYLWIGALFSGDGATTPVLRQLRVEFDHPTYDAYLPAVYRNSEDCKEFLVRLLSLFESLFAEVEKEIVSLPALFDPRAAAKPFLAWLAGCLGLALDENWDETKQRKLIAEIFHLYGWRGTPAGLREILRRFLGVSATIEEPLQFAAWWALPTSATTCCNSCAAESANGGSTDQDSGTSILGWTTMLAPAAPQGAVLGTSAILDQSHLLTADEFGSPLFADVAYQFSVQVFRRQVQCAESLAHIRAILDQEKPAHTTYHLCIVEPRMRVGFQARLGIDTVIGGPPRGLSLGSEHSLGQDTALAGAEETRLGAGSRVGFTTRLS